MKARNIIAYILLALVCTGFLQAEGDDNQESAAFIADQPMDLLGTTRKGLKKRIEELESRVMLLETKSNGTGNNNLQPAGNETTGLTEKIIPFLFIVIVICIIVAFIVLVITFLKNKPHPKDVAEKQEGKTEAAGYESKPEPSNRRNQPVLDSTYRSSQAAQSSKVAPRSSQVERSSVLGNPPQSPCPGTSTIPLSQRPVTAPQPIPPRPTSAPPPAVPPAQQSEDLSVLFQSKDLRDKRRVGGAGDLYLDLNEEIATRIVQGEKISPVFEEGGNFMSAPYVLIQGKYLYPNFNRFNEGRPIPKDKETTLQQIYDVEGSLPSFVDKCVPAQVRQQANQYTIVGKGKLVIRTPAQM
jgi:hypothetical protein